ncbi:hypothetical protein [Duganella radicis]|uniref:Uncharacterized protein n=1 Tax=Duganella radicis TaxID=551988 RepID=A0A6L6PLF8_9BURK|nr:hypothetical protein [Duganella radicis]MTV39950.1 hypothetical protein [Duganella radicis]
MKLVLFEYTCKCCGNFYKAPQINPYAYGEFLLRKRNSPTLRYLDALNTPAYAEVADELRVNEYTRALDDITRADVLQIIFGSAACDPDVDGEPFELGLLPCCTDCGETVSISWQITDPIEFVEKDLIPATFSGWLNLTGRDRKKKVLAVLTRLSRFAPTRGRREEI